MATDRPRPFPGSDSPEPRTAPPLSGPASNALNVPSLESSNRGPLRIYTGEPCSCRPGIERDNCPSCEGTGRRLDFAAIRSARLESTPERYCKPWNTGLQSTSSAVARRLGRLFDALSDEITSNVVRGEIVEDIRRFRFDLLERLESEGWFGTYDGGNRFKVYPPGSPTGARKRADMERRLGGDK